MHVIVPRTTFNPRIIAKLTRELASSGKAPELLAQCCEFLARVQLQNGLRGTDADEMNGLFGALMDTLELELEISQPGEAVLGLETEKAFLDFKADAKKRKAG
jgi:hypothetical protein